MLLDTSKIKKGKRSNPDHTHVSEIGCPLHFKDVTGPNDVTVTCRGVQCPAFRLTHPHAQEGENNHGLGYCGLGGRP